jgi:phosphopantothenoylcysteine decarboxylase/phosphopantothenate--cysteine ligase
MKSRPEKSGTGPLDGYEVLVAVTGGIAAYKVCHVVSHLVQRGAGVTVAMTRSARKFVGPTTFQALTGRRVLTGVWTDEEPGDVQHIAMSGAADLMLVAPATANIIGKVAAGIADDIVTTLVISQDSPVLLAPAMNTRMWQNRVVQRNLTTLRELGYGIIDPGEGWLACRTVGPGRMAEPDEILDAVVRLLEAGKPKAELQGTKARGHGGTK